MASSAFSRDNGRDAGQRRYGAAVRPDQLVDDTPLLTAIRRCDILVPEYHGQWSAVEWRKGEPWYGNYDAIVNFAETHGMAVRGHALIWEKMTPDWARAEMLEKRDWRTVTRHFADLLPRYSGRIADWIVVNEMIDTEDGENGLRRTSFQRAYGKDYVAMALLTANGLDPQARLMINDYALCYDNPVDEARRNALLRLVENLKARGIPLHSVGLQGHLELAKGAIPQARLARFMADLADTGVKLAVTELDAIEADRHRPLAERDAAVADHTQSFLDVAMDQPAVESIVTWGLSDRHSWLQENAPDTLAAVSHAPIDGKRLNRGLPFDADMKPKRMQVVLNDAMRIQRA
ncbi:endo-1,4-beta-xylanase [Novosphingobium rosa]|uniref:endo-1,4-beta-xylanase n=1 Tax=Novosphingobium rosa TaxID=76978 RepID=UPI00147173B3|nr:endo-1,4-beta-xylanase [Novosphingobium rosa]